ncbi:hypothetical protein C5S32_08030 [ANME-1 cluster archaeon GoMg1]|nr:hypothetical protein [ANME-1 cluster archaeon GoMg1]
MRRKTTIVQMGGAWPINIGNAFIELGSIYTIKKALGDCNVVLCSSLPKCFLSRGALSTPVRILDFSITDKTSNLFDIREAIKADYVVFSDATLTENWMKLCFPDKLLKKNKDTKIIINGGGGGSYTEREIEIVRDYFKKMNLCAFISRDVKAFRAYEGIAEHSFNGIDCGFFVNNYFAPPTLDLPRYITLTFDKKKEPKLKNEKRTIIRTHHWCWSESGFLKRVIYYKGGFNKKNTLISDLPQDYLVVYANTEETHSDRVHACVPTLAFGKPAKLYSDTRRALLFDRVNAGSIKSQLTYPDTKKIEKEKERQIRFLSEILDF